MLKKLFSSALCISLIATSVSAIAASDVDFTTTHFFANEIDKQYVLDALSPNAASRWNYASPVGTPVTITYAFSSAENSFPLSGTNTLDRDYLQYEKDPIVELLNEVASFTNITFIESTGVNATDIYFVIQNSAGNGANLAPSNAVEHADSHGISFSESSNLRYLNPDRELNYERFVHYDVDYKHDVARSKWFIAHEIGHALGLVHPFSINGSNTSPLNDNDGHKFNTVMAYNSPLLSSETYESSSYQVYDIIALQNLYGKNLNKNTGDTLFEYDDTYDFRQTIIDSDGNDTISVANSERNNVIDLRGGKFSSIAPNFVSWYDDCYDGSYEGEFTTNPDGTCTEADGGHEHLNRSHNSLSIELDTLIENATGGNGDDILVANSVANTLSGGNGTDTVIFSGTKTDYTIEIVNSYTVIVTSVANPENINTLTDIEVLSFVTDFSDLSTAETVTFNSTPSINSITAEQTVDELTTVTLTVAATDVDVNDTLTYRWVVSGASVTLTDSTTDTVTFTAPDVASDTTLTVEVFVSDNIDTISTTSTVIVTHIEDPVVEAPAVTPTKKESSGGSFGYFILLIVGLRLFRK